jgi:hypothetical protein
MGDDAQATRPPEATWRRDLFRKTGYPDVGPLIRPNRRNRGWSQDRRFASLAILSSCRTARYPQP